jgi:hypothetical protein
MFVALANAASTPAILYELAAPGVPPSFAITPGVRYSQPSAIVRSVRASAGGGFGFSPGFSASAEPEPTPEPEPAVAGGSGASPWWFA